MRSDNERAKGCASGQAQNRWMEGINMNWKPFGIGFVVGVALLSGISHYRARTQNVIKTWPEDYQKSMKVIAPWLTEAKVGRIGPFIAMAPKSFDTASEAMIQAIIKP